MGKKIVKLTEEKFNKIITTAVEKVLNEVAMLGNFNENIREILDKHESIFNTAGEHKIEEIFDGYKKKEEAVNI